MPLSRHFIAQVMLLRYSNQLCSSGRVILNVVYIRRARAKGMRRMIKLHREHLGFLLLSTMALAPVAANAADLYRSAPPPPPSYVPAAAYVDSYSWAGFYAGVNGGYGWSNGGNSIGYNDGGLGFIGGTDRSARAQPQGAFGGGQMGY